MSLLITPLTPEFGAVIEGVDIPTLDDDRFGELIQAFTKWGVVFLKGEQALTPEAHIAFA